MNKLERVAAVLEGRQPDRPPFSFWHHFELDQQSGPAAVDAHLWHLERYDLDFLKIMNDHDYPRAGAVVQSLDDLKALPALTGLEGPFGAQLEVIADLRARLGREIFMTTTVFSPWAVLRKLVAPESRQHGPPTLDFSGDARDAAISRLIKEDRSVVKAALEVIARSLAAFAKACLEAGANGIYLSVRDDWVDAPENGKGTYGDLARGPDLTVLAGAAAGSFNVVHICGRALDFKAFAGYPCQVLSWADRYAGPPISAAAGIKPVICAGVDNLGTLVRGTPQQVRAEVRDALAQAASRPMIVAPGCTFDAAAVPEDNLLAIGREVREGRRS